MSRPADILRESRKHDLDHADQKEREAAELEARATTLRAQAVNLRERSCQLGGAIQVLDGDGAPLELPAGVARPSMLDVL